MCFRRCVQLSPSPPLFRLGLKRATGPVVVDAQRSKKTTKTTLRSECRSALKKDWTGPTLLEVSGLPTNQAGGIISWSAWAYNLPRLVRVLSEPCLIIDFVFYCS